MAQTKKQKQLVALKLRQADCKKYKQFIDDTPNDEEHARTLKMWQSELKRAQDEAKSLFNKLGLNPNE